MNTLKNLIWTAYSKLCCNKRFVKDVSAGIILPMFLELQQLNYCLHCIFPIFSMKYFKSSLPQDTTKSLVWAVCWRTRKWVQQISDSIAALFFLLSCVSTVWSCWTMVPTWVAKTAWLAISLLARAFILSAAIFQLVNDFFVQTPSFFPIDVPDTLQILKNSPSQSASYCSQVYNSLSPIVSVFPSTCRRTGFGTFLGYSAGILVEGVVWNWHLFPLQAQLHYYLHYWCRWFIRAKKNECPWPCQTFQLNEVLNAWLLASLYWALGVCYFYCWLRWLQLRAPPYQ